MSDWNDPNLAAMRDRLIASLRGHGRVAVAFSGGIDSTVVAQAAHLALGDEAIAITAVSDSLAEGEREEAEALARQIGIRHRVIRTNEFADPNYLRNKDMVNSRVNQLDNRENQTMTAAGATGATIATGPQGQMREAQGRLLSGLEDTIAGKGPSAAQEQLRQATDANIAGGLAMAV